MPLPKVKHALFELTVPSLKKKLKFRSYLGREEKILLTAKESGEASDIIMSLKQVIQNCCEEEQFDANQLTTFDVEYLFLKLRSKSVDNIVNITYLDPEDSKEHKFNVDLNEVEMLQESEVDSIITLDEQSGIEMRYPTMAVIDNMPEFKSTTDEFSYLLKNCVVQIFDGDDVYPMSDVTTDEFNDWVDSLPVPVLKKMKDFLQSAPKMYYELKYTNDRGKPKKIILRSLSDFFTLG